MAILTVAQILISILLIAAVLLQQRGTGLSPVLGGDSGSYRTRRGLERTLFIATIILAVLFLATALLTVIVQ